MGRVGRLDGKVAIVTGAARGQGEAEARLFAAEGARVVLCDVLDEPGAAIAGKLGDMAIFRHLDVADEQGWTEAVALAESAFGRLDILVNNAGILRFAKITDATLDDYMAVVRVNQIGTFLGMRAAIPAMRRAGGGSIVNIASVEGVVGMHSTVAYASTKGAIRAMTKVAAIEVGRHGIRVNAVLPGGVDTPMVRIEGFEETDMDPIFKRTPLRRIGRPEEIARVVLFLASDESSFCTGAEFAADGGMLATSVLNRGG